ncbi:hypothetical protein KC328_g16696, partial [Hortaea werneckii]
KKRKTEQPEEVGDDEEPEREDDGEVEGAELEDDDDEEAGADNDEDEDADETATKGGPAASAKRSAAGKVPKESDLKEVEAAEKEDEKA